MSYLYVAATIVLTIYGQIIVKWQVGEAGPFPSNMGGRLEFLLRLTLNPWVLSAFTGAFIAALCWMAAMTKLQLSHAYPFMALSFVFVLLLSGIFFGEPVTAPKIAGVVLIALGLVIGSAL